MSRTAAAVDRAAPGIYVRGTVVRRTRRVVGKEETVVVTYGVNVGDTVVDVEEWKPEEFFEIGAAVDVDVRVRPYVTKSNRACVQIELHKAPRGAF